MGLKTGILWGMTEKKKEEEKEKKEEKTPHMCDSIGHRPLRGRCPKNEFMMLQL